MSVRAEGDVEVSVIHSGSGDVHLGGRDIVLRDVGLYSQLAGEVSLTATGVLRMAPGTQIRSDQGVMRVHTGGQMDIWRIVSQDGDINLDAGGPVHVVGPDLHPQVVTAGNLDIQSRLGVAGYGFERLYVDVAELTGYNSQTGDVVISGWKGLRIGQSGYQSDSDKGWLVLMSGRAGVIEASGEVKAAGDRVARISGKTVILPAVLPGRQMQNFNAYVVPPFENSPAADTLAQLNASLREDWLAAISGSSLKAPGLTPATSSTNNLLGGHRTAAWGGSAFDEMHAALKATDLLEAALKAASQVRSEDVYAADPLNAWAQRSFLVRQHEGQATEPPLLTPQAPSQEASPVSVQTPTPVKQNNQQPDSTKTDVSAPLTELTESMIDLALLEITLQALADEGCGDKQARGLEKAGALCPIEES